MPQRLKVSLKKIPAITVNRIAIGDLKLVYVACANKQIKYPNGSSPVVYIGTTKNGISRVASSVAYRSEHILNEHGIVSFDVRIITCGVRQRVKTWHKLERALLIAFRAYYGAVPLCNTHGKNFIEGSEFEFFSQKRIIAILSSLEKTGAPRGRPISN